MNYSCSRAPLLLNASVSLASGGGAVADAVALSSPFRKPVWINEIRWTIGSNLSAPSNGGSQGALVSTQIKVGRVDITRGFIPIWNLGPSLQRADGGDDYSESILDAATSNTQTQWAHHRWLLPRPLYVLPGTTLSSSFRRSSTSGAPFSGNFTIDVAYAGCYAHPEEPIPKEIAVPFAAVWQPASSAYVISGELDLANPFLVPLHVQRFIGRLSATFGSSAGYEEYSLTNGNVTVMMKDSQGYSIIKDLTTFSNAFDYLRRAWTFQRTLAPKEWYTAYVRGLSGASRVCTVSLIGWRNEVYS